MLGQKRLCKTSNKFARHLVMRKSTLSAHHSECHRVIWKKFLLRHLTPSGSYRAAQYAASFPRHVGNFVLDAVIPHGRVGTLSVINFKRLNYFKSSFDRVQDSIAALNRGILRADAYCQNNSSCPWHSNGTGIIPTVCSPIDYCAGAFVDLDYR
jgi:hypothetical protein